MRNLVVLNQNAARRSGECLVAATVEMHGVPVTIALIETPDTRFDAGAPHRAHDVFVRIRAVSCSYRDQTVILGEAMRRIGEGAAPIGTEFVGEVVAVGREVARFQVGDRAIPMPFMPEDPAGWRTPRRTRFGMPTEHAGREWSVFDEEQLLRVPDSMPDDVAASFSTCAQTAYAMIRKAGAERGTRVLVTAPNSSTSLFAIAALAGIGAEVYAVGTSNRHEGRLRELGVRELAVVDPKQENVELPVSLRQPDCVLDVFADLYFSHALNWLAPGGVYVTCGVLDQFQRHLLNTRASNVSFDLTDAFASMVGRNLRVIGSCLGLPADLENALRDFEGGVFRSVVDAAFSGEQVGEYLRRSFVEPDRFGKVVYRF